jgi:uncharacterized repeat protein (TIGR02543 family)
VGSVTAIRGGAYPPLPAPTRTGYTFKGWYLDAACKVAYAPGAAMLARGDVTVYAKWAANKYRVKLHVNKGKALKKPKRVKTVTFDKKYGKLPSPTRKGYKFKGWYTKKKGGARIKAGTVVRTAKAATLYAHWAKKPKKKK